MLPHSLDLARNFLGRLPNALGLDRCNSETGLADSEWEGSSDGAVEAKRADSASYFGHGAVRGEGHEGARESEAGP